MKHTERAREREKKEKPCIMIVHFTIAGVLNNKHYDNQPQKLHNQEVIYMKKKKRNKKICKSYEQE